MDFILVQNEKEYNEGEKEILNENMAIDIDELTEILVEEVKPA